MLGLWTVAGWNAAHIQNASSGLVHAWKLLACTQDCNVQVKAIQKQSSRQKVHSMTFLLVTDCQIPSQQIGRQISTLDVSHLLGRLQLPLADEYRIHLVA